VWTADPENFSDLQKARLAYVPPLPAALATPRATAAVPGDATASRSAAEEAILRHWFPRTYGSPVVNLTAAADGPEPSQRKPVRVGVVFSGRQSPGGHGVVAGLFDFLKQLDAANEVVGICGGTRGLFEQRHIVLSAERLATYRNQGGYHLLGRSVDKIRGARECAAAAAAVAGLRLDGLVIIGGTYR
jgi:pyrophosphate--fructose-6-phosphate 1-phosphotransferase